jgi:energy-coupling factor transport system permease protein
MFHTGAWVIWLVAAAVPAFTLHNPLYSALILVSAWITYTAVVQSSPLASSWGSFIRIGTFLFALTIPFNAMSNHFGRIVLFRLPATWPIIGGAITLEAIVAGAVNGLALLSILVIFAAFNAGVDHYQLLRATPAFLFQAGVVISIAITFVPQMILSAKEIREAQLIRGHRFRGIRDLLPLILPLLASGLERAIQLAETMEARGFGSTVVPLSRWEGIRNQLATVAALVSLLVGLVVITYFPGQSRWGWGLVGLAGAGLLAVFVVQGRRVHRTRYRRTDWAWRDTALASAGAVVVAVVVAARLTTPESLVYTPYPPSSLLPPFNPYAGTVLLLLALPALLAPRIRNHERRNTERVS